MLSNQQPQSLEALLQQEIQSASRLLTILKQEYEALKGRDPAAIEQAAATKQQCVEAFEVVEQRRASLMQGANGNARLTPDPQTNKRISSLWEELRQVAGQCQQQNQVNGGVTELGRRRTERCLEILLGQDPATETYGPGGKRQRPRSGGSGVTA